ncbi:MAG TPA: response regulator [Trichocoleus sp.]|jgi:CheY-like chemotaxis protein
MNQRLDVPLPIDLRILIVDDISDNSFLLQTFLEAEGYQVDIADNGQTALEKIEAAPPALVLLDVMMPGMSGYEVTRHVRQNPALPYIPILLITGFDQTADSKGFDVGVDGFIRKPVDFDQLLAQVRSLLSQNSKAVTKQ